MRGKSHGRYLVCRLSSTVQFLLQRRQFRFGPKTKTRASISTSVNSGVTRLIMVVAWFSLPQPGHLRGYRRHAGSPCPCEGSRLTSGDLPARPGARTRNSGVEGGIHPGLYSVNANHRAARALALILLSLRSEIFMVGTSSVTGWLPRSLSAARYPAASVRA